MRAQESPPTSVQIEALVAQDGQENDALGLSVALSGDLLVAGAPHNFIDDSQRAGAVYLFARNQGGIDAWGPVAKLTADDAAPYDQFGKAVAIEGDLIVVGATAADVSDGSGNLKLDQGAVYIFGRNLINPNQWDPLQKLVAGDGAAEDHFGTSVAMDGGRILVGSRFQAYLFERSGGVHSSWVQKKVLRGSDAQPDSRFGEAVALRGDLALVGAPGDLFNGVIQGAAYLFQHNQGGMDNWGEIKKLVASDGRLSDRFGNAVLLWEDRAIVAAQQLDFGQVLIFAQQQGGPNNWGEVQRLSGPINPFARSFGSALALDETGDHLAVRTLEEAYVFEIDPAQNDQWRVVRHLVSTRGDLFALFGAGIAIRERWAFVGAPDAFVAHSSQGLVYLFDYTAAAAPTLNFSQATYQVQEGVGTATITLTLDRPNPYPSVTVHYRSSQGGIDQASAPDDFLPVDATLTLPQHATQATFTVTIVNDNLLEQTESLFLQIDQPSGAILGQPSFASLTIEDDDPTLCDFIATDEASLDRAIRCVNVAGAGTHTISVTQDISFTQPSTLIVNPEAAQITIEGNHHRLDAQGHGRLFTLYLSRLHIRNLSLTGGRIPLADNTFEGGGAIALFGSHGDGSCRLTLENTLLADNEATGGGAILNGCDDSQLILDYVIVRDNHAIYGGALYIPTGEELFSELVIRHSQIVHNQAEKQGGGIYLAGGDAGSNASIRDSTIAENTVVDGPGGGISVRTGDAAGTNLTLQAVAILSNTANSGGGIQIDPTGVVNLVLANSTLSSNRAISGTGGGLLSQARGEASGGSTLLINSTLANNTASEGGGLYILDGGLTLSNTLIADNPTGGDCRLVTSPDRSSRYTSGGHNLDSDGSCLPEIIRQPSDLPNGTANVGSLADNGGETLTHALLAGSQAIDAGNDADCAAEPVNGVDQRGIQRPQGAHCEIGAYEAAGTSPANQWLLVSSTSSGRVGNLIFNNEDILAFHLQTEAWSIFLDGGDVGIIGDLDAFTLLPDGSLLLSLNNPQALPEVGLVDDSDIVHFMPSQLGANTAGHFAFYLRGSEVGLESNSEDIDAISFDKAGRLLISTIGLFNADGLAGRDADLFVRNEGKWALYFQGADVGLTRNDEDLKAAWIDPATAAIYLATKGTYSVTETSGIGMQGDADDIFVCTPQSLGLDTRCTFRRFWNGDDHAFGQERIDGIVIGDAPTSFVPSADSGLAALSETMSEAMSETREAEENLEIQEGDEEMDEEIEEGETLQSIFLPWVGQ